MTKHRLARKLWIAAAALAAGTLPNDCQMTVRNSLVNATRATVATMLDPANFDFEGLFQQLLPPR